VKRNSLTPRQSKAIIHLIEADTVSEAAQRSGVSRPTLYSWLKDPAFQDELAQARRADHQARMNALGQLMPKALAVLSKLMDNCDPRVRQKAASEVIKAYQALAQAEPPVPQHALEPNDEELTAESPRELTLSCIKRLLSGSLDGRAAQMMPSYLRLLERLEEEENGLKRHGEEEPRVLEAAGGDGKAGAPGG
jgi:hypothetical protein